MIRRVILAIGCLALLTSFSRHRRADAITFSFVFSSNPVHADATGLTAGPALNVLVSDTKLHAVFPLIGSASLSTGPASSYSAGPTMLSAFYTAGSGIDVEVDSASCVGGALPGICLQGDFDDDGEYQATLGSTGSFQGLFTVTYVSPYVTSLFSDPNVWLPTGSDSLDTAFNMFTNRGFTDTAVLSGGTITFQTPVPEPGTLTMLATGIMGLAGFIRRRTS